MFPLVQATFEPIDPAIIVWSIGVVLAALIVLVIFEAQRQRKRT